jgi:ankyrin repeat protein/transcriptional regulator with XRE-family HTH domain
MDERTKGEFLRKRMIELREKNHKSQSEMAELLFVNKSTLSRVESGASGYKKIQEYAGMYCDKLGVTGQQREIFMRGEKIVVTDTSALLKNIQLIDELSKEYSKVVVPRIVIDELDNIKDHSPQTLASRAWQILRSIGSNQNVITMEYSGDDSEANNDSKIIAVAEDVMEQFHCSVDIITYDTGFAARLSGKETIQALFLENYMATKQNLSDIDSLKKIDEYYAESYEDIEKVLGIPPLSGEDINAYLANGNTLIISAVRNKHPIRQRIAKVRWLIEHGADVNRRDCGKYYFPPLSHAIQTNDFEMFKFLLHDCQANPNIGSRNPYDAGKIRQKNDGNMPLMIAAWDNKIPFVRELCADPRTSLNQQDGNGFTALIKACYWGWLECRDILIAAGADEKIVDRDGYTAQGRYEEFLETGRRKNTQFRKKQRAGVRR